MNNVKTNKPADAGAFRKMKKLVSPQGVVWPSRKSCWHKTGIVICTCIAFGAVLIAADSLFGLVFQFLIG